MISVLCQYSDMGIDKIKDKNFDRPSALDSTLFKPHLKALKVGQKIKKPVYDFTNHKRVGYEDYFPPPE